MNTSAWMIVAFAAVAAGVGAYVASLAVRQRSVTRRLEELGRMREEEHPPARSG